MRYELDNNGYICKVFFGCHSGTCTLYEGDIPTGYTSLVEWADNANIRAYKIVSGNLTYDAERDAELQKVWEKNCLVVDGITSKNLFTGFVIGVGLNTTTGVQTTSSTAATSGYIPVNFNENERYFLSGLSNEITSFIAAYNSNFEFLGRTGGDKKTIASLHINSFVNGTPQGTGDIAYLRVIQYGTAETVQVVKDLKVQLEVGDKATSYSPFFDSIIESGENENGSWEKWASGKMICRGMISKTVEGGHTTLSNGMYVSSTVNVSFPQPFANENIHINTNANKNAGDTVGAFVFTRGISNTGFITWSALLVSSTSTGWTRTYEAIGKWK